jgi:hypothetical protein
MKDVVLIRFNVPNLSVYEFYIEISETHNFFGSIIHFNFIYLYSMKSNFWVSSSCNRSLNFLNECVWVKNFWLHSEIKEKNILILGRNVDKMRIIDSDFWTNHLKHLRFYQVNVFKFTIINQKNLTEVGSQDWIWVENVNWLEMNVWIDSVDHVLNLIVLINRINVELKEVFLHIAKGDTESAFL